MGLKENLELLMVFMRKFQYTCPYCGHVNGRDIKAINVVCDKCKKTFEQKEMQQ